MNDINKEEKDRRVQRSLARYRNDNGVLWFSKLGTIKGKDLDTGLIGYYGELHDGIVIAKDVKGSKSDYKMFAYFKDIREVHRYCVDRQGPKNYYEVVGAVDPRQRPYFDIDINPNTFPPDVNYTDHVQSIMVKIISTIVLTMSLKYGIRLTPDNFSLYSSDYPVDTETGHPTKYSYHILIKGYYFSNSQHMRDFGQSLNKTLGPLSIYVDDIWYKTRQFRLLGSSKLGKNAPKYDVRSLGGLLPAGLFDRLAPEDRNNDIDILQLSESLVTNTNHCTLLA